MLKIAQILKEIYLYNELPSKYIHYSIIPIVTYRMAA